MFPPENDEGNVEYKRHLCTQELKYSDSELNIRFQQLVTQLKFRLSEGDGIAIYYIGVEDDGSIYNLSKKERNESISILKKMTKYLDAKIDNIKFDINFIMVIIKQNWKESILEEKRILLLGDTETGKTTFLAYLVKNKLDSKICKSRLYILNHKHELETGKTSSFNYQYINHNNIKYVFIDTPGISNNKTRNKSILSFDFDLILFFNKPNITWDKKNMFIEYAKYFSIPYININLFDESSFINLINPLDQSNIFEYFNKNFNLNCKLEKNKNFLANFYLLQSFPHMEMGWILSGFLESGSLKVNQDLLWYDYNMIPVKINSIYKNNLPIKEICGPSTITITLDDDNMINNKPRFGFLSNIKHTNIFKIKIKWIYYNNKEILENENILIYVKNQTINLNKLNNFFEYKLINPEYSFNLINKIFIYENNNNFAFGMIIA